jgi:hypothetical protein
MTAIELKVTKEQLLPPKNRSLTGQWTEIQSRIFPLYQKKIKWSQFEHKVSVSRSVIFDRVVDWCEENVGPIDREWTYRDISTVMFKDHEHAVQLSLLVDSLQ